MTRVKVCGLTRECDVRAALSLGADALGFILAPSRRRVTLERAASLVRGLPPFVSVVGVLSDPTVETLQETVRSRLFDCLQFHGSERPSILAGLPLKTIKAFGISSGEDLNGTMPYGNVADYFLFDTKADGASGGTGRTFDWSVLAKIRPDRPFILAGGLGPENIREALDRVRPSAVDLNSRIEAAPGVKDPDLMARAILAVKNDNQRGDS
ncbi:MAG: phosphoribosylanthranilate isomerase [Synergistales bacterium]